MMGKKARKRERETERDVGREGEQHSGDRKQSGLILTVGLNQQHLRISTKPENFFGGVNQLEQWRDNYQSRFGVVFNIPHLIWLDIICSNNTRSTHSISVEN